MIRSEFGELYTKKIILLAEFEGGKERDSAARDVGGCSKHDMILTLGDIYIGPSLGQLEHPSNCT